MAWTSPRTWVAAEKPSAATLNTHIRDNFKAIGDAWTAYVPTLGNVTLGNGTIVGAYMQAGKTIAFSIKLTLGSTSSITGSPTFTLPVASTGGRTVAGSLMMFDSSTSGDDGGFYFNSSASVLQIRNDASAPISSTVPFTWATGDEIFMTGTYQAA